MKKILIANRGEIALRVMRSAKEMGIQTVAIFSEADRNAPFVRYADESICVGPPPSSQSYLQGDKILEICKVLGVDAIHPGYGFLSENADFARKVKKAGITFIGPSAEAMDMMGDKLSAKATAKKYNVPMIPGSDGAISDLAEATKIAKEIGIDGAKLNASLKDNQEKILKILQANSELGASIGISGTPGFIIGEELIPGALDAASFKAKIAALRSK